MPHVHKLIAGLALALTAISCSDDKNPTAPVNQTLTPPAAKVTKQPLIFQGAQTFNGVAYTNTVQVTKFNYTQTGGLTVDGRIIWKDASGAVVNTQDFTGWAATLTKSGAPTQPTCQILNLDIGAVHLDLLGLVVDLAPVHLDITAVSGSGNLLGNLLCALVGILDGPNIGGLLATIQQLLNQINAILAGL